MQRLSRSLFGGLAAALIFAMMCRPAAAACRSAAAEDFLEGVQIETADLRLYEAFFGTLLQAEEVDRRDHPGLDRIRGYCYREVLVVIRQDLKTPRPTGWVQINFGVSDVSAIQAALTKRYDEAFAGLDESRRSAIARIRLKPDVRRGGCRVTRLELGGPEGFMIGFDQIKHETCEGGHHGGGPP
jgi:hypothetical protein